MSGHSHWAGIKYKKAILDAKRGKVWSKIARMIIASAKTGGPDPAQNLTLRYAIDKAKAANMPKDTIEKAIKKAAGSLNGVNYESVLYEGYAAGGIAVMIDALTDNRNRTAPEIKKIFEKRSGALGASGCVNWMFSKKGLITIKTSDISENELMEMALSSGADDMVNTGNIYELTCAPAAFEQLKKALREREIALQVAEISMIPQNTVTVNDTGTAERVLALMDELEEHDDVQNVYANFDIPDEIIKTIRK